MKIQNKKRFILSIAIGVFALAINVFIIVQACLDGMRSTESSGIVVDLLKGMINGISPNAINDGNINTFTHVIRKLVGHFGLFAFSGVFTSWSIHLGSYYLKKYQWYMGLVFTLCFGMFLAGLTELIQSFVPERSGQFTDVLIDFAGYILGTGIVVLILFIIYKVNKKKSKKTE